MFLSCKEIDYAEIADIVLNGNMTPIYRKDSKEIDFATFINEIFAFKKYCVNFRVRADSKFSPTGSAAWITGTAYLLNTSLTYSEVGHIIATIGSNLYIARIMSEKVQEGTLSWKVASVSIV